MKKKYFAPRLEVMEIELESPVAASYGGHDYVPSTGGSTGDTPAG